MAIRILGVVKDIKDDVPSPLISLLPQCPYFKVTRSLENIEIALPLIILVPSQVYI